MAAATLFGLNDGISDRYKYELNGEALGLGVSGGVTALCLTLLTAAVSGGVAAQNTGHISLMLQGRVSVYMVDTLPKGNMNV